MARLRVGTPEFELAFGGLVDRVAQFTSRMPTHQELQNAYLDPSARVNMGLDSAASILARKTHDVQLGAQSIFFDLAADLGTEVGRNVAFPSNLLGGLRSIMESSPVGNALSDADVLSIFSGEQDKALKGVGNLALGVGLAAVGTAIPVVGQIGAAVVAIGRAIFSVLERQKEMLDSQRAEVREQLWASFPDLQTADSGTDAAQVQYGLRPILASNDWTRAFLPRFTGDWVGIERQNGFAFAPGKTEKWSDTFGKDTQAFVPSGGMGLIPGTNVLTSVLQVNLNPRGSAVQRFLQTGQYDPRIQGPPDLLRSGAQHVIDTGTFYEASRNLCVLAWEQAIERGSPYMYRLDVPKMHDEWKRYAEAGIDFIKQRVFPWWDTLGKFRTEDKLADLNLEGLFGSSVFFAIGSWACLQDGGTDSNPTLALNPAPSGRWRDAIKHARLFPGSEYSGGFLPIQNPRPWWPKCMGNIYTRQPDIRKTLLDLQYNQRWCLKHTLVCAYVRESDAAFRDPALLDLLRKMRAVLLQSDDRFAVNMLDVPLEEPHEGQDWSTRLLKSGVPKTPNKVMGGNKKKLSIDPSDEPEPTRPPFHAGDIVPPAWGARPQAPPARRWWPIVAGATGVTLATGWAWSRRKR